MNINLDSAKDTLCKNILIYGYCKFENKGCVFSHNRKSKEQPPPHENKEQEPSTEPPTGSSESKKKFNLNTPSFLPSSFQVNNLSNKFSNLSPKIKDVPSFKPETPINNKDNNEVFGSKRFNMSTPSFTPSTYDFNSTSASPSINNLQPPPNSSSSNISIQAHQHPQPPSQTQMGPDFFGNQQIPQIPLGAPMAGALPQQGMRPPPPPQVQIQSSNSNHYPLQYHLYAPTPPPRLSIPLQPHETNSSGLFIPNDLREYLHKKNEASLQILHHSNLPDHINYYHSLVPIDKSYDIKSKLWSDKNSIVFKCFSNLDGNTYVLRKIEPVEILNEKPFKTIKLWIKKIKGNANIVEMKDCFTTMSFGNYSSLCVIYDYFPNSITLFENHKKGIKLEPINEESLWTYLIQLINAVKFVHKNKLSVKSSMNLTKIIVTNKNRIRLSSIGISDIIEREKEPDFEETEEQMIKSQLNDIHNLGKVLFELSILLLPINHRNLINLQDIELKAINQLRNSTNLSDEWCDSLQQLIFANDDFDLDKFERSVSSQMLTTINELQHSTDIFENRLMTELENGRLFRLMTKINFVLFNSKMSQFQIKILKSFQDYLYNSFDSNGRKSTNLSRILVNLNKLDCGIDEKILLIGNSTNNDGGKNNECIIVSYKEIKELIDGQFRLMRE